MQNGHEKQQNLRLPISYFVFQVASAILLLPVLAYIRGGAVRDRVMSMLPFLADQEWIWIEFVVSLVLLGLAGRVFFASARKRQVESS